LTALKGGDRLPLFLALLRAKPYSTFNWAPSKTMDNIERLLSLLVKQPGWENYRQFCSVIDCWQTVVGEKIANNTRPIYIARKVLWVATSSSVWAQTLSMQRYTLLKKLNLQLSDRLSDIRFSSAQWYQNTNLQKDAIASVETTKKHPSRINLDYSQLPLNKPPENNTPQVALARCNEAIKRRSQHLPFCPQCNCPTPFGELERWGLCCHCAAKKWSEKPKNDSEENI
jgi:predicted nucleic acid-binding Zn ribbon protein